MPVVFWFLDQSWTCSYTAGYIFIKERTNKIESLESSLVQKGSGKKNTLYNTTEIETPILMWTSGINELA